MKNQKNKKTNRTAATYRLRLGRPAIRMHHIGGVLLAVLGGVAFSVTMLSQPVQKSSAATGCAVSPIFVNSCRPLLGSSSSNHPEAAADPKSQLLDHEQRIGRRLDVVHTYHPAGNDSLSSSDLYFLNRGTTLVTNWRPSDKFTDGTGGNATINAGIDQMAKSIKAAAPHKLILVLYHEPEDNVSGGAAGCPAGIYKGNAGTPADYVALWHNVRARFDALGVNNVVWGMNYMGFPAWNCMEKEMWPGNSYVDWVMWDPYVTTNTTSFVDSVSRFYDFLTANSTPTTDYLSKPWAVDEWGAFASVDQPHTYKEYDDAKAALDSNTFPRIKMYNMFDSLNLLTDYTPAGVKDMTEQAHYNSFAQDPRFTDAFYTQSGGSGAPSPAPQPQPAPAPSPGPVPSPQPTGDTTLPTIMINGPAANSTVSKTVSVEASASDDVRVKAVTLLIDGAYKQTESSQPYSFSFDTTKYPDGNHTITLRAFDTSDNMAEAKVLVTIKNSQPGIIISAGGGAATTVNGQPVTASAGSESAPIPVKGILEIVANKPDTAVAITVDGKPVAGNTVDTTGMTNGVHRVGITEGTDRKVISVSVHNPWYRSIVNDLKASPVLYDISIGGAFAVGIGLWLLRSHIYYAIEAYKTRKYVRF